MKIKSTLAILGLASILTATSCSLGKEKEVAADACGCTKALENKLSPTLVNIIVESSNAENPEKAIEEKMAALDSDQMMAIVPDLEILAELESEDGEFIQCVNGLEKKYENAYTFNEEESMKEVLVEMGKLDCAFGVAVLKMGLNAK
jgi:hypothetical protein